MLNAEIPLSKALDSMELRLYDEKPIPFSITFHTQDGKRIALVNAKRTGHKRANLKKHSAINVECKDEQGNIRKCMVNIYTITRYNGLFVRI